MLTPRLSERLDALAHTAEQLPVEEQDKLADQIAAIVDNTIWDAQLRDPADLAILRELAEEARRGPKLAMPTPRDTGDEEALEPDVPRTLQADV